MNLKLFLNIDFIYDTTALLRTDVTEIQTAFFRIHSIYNRFMYIDDFPMHLRKIMNIECAQFLFITSDYVR